MKGKLIFVLVLITIFLLGCTKLNDNVFLIDSNVSVGDNESANISYNSSSDISINVSESFNDISLFENKSVNGDFSVEDDDIKEEEFNSEDDEIIVDDIVIVDSKINDESQVIDLIEDNSLVNDDVLLFQGDSIWVYGSLNETEYDKYIQLIKKINKNSSIIKYLFVWAGEVTKKENESAKVSFKTERIDYLRDNLEDIILYPMIESSKDVSNNLTEEDIEIVSVYLKNLTKDLEYNGVHFDLEPINDATSKIISRYSKAYPGLVISSAVVRYESDFEKILDFMVLMNYAQCQDNIDDFSKVTRSRYTKFRDLCIENSQYCMHGLMLTKTSCEKDDIDNYALESLKIHDSFDDNKYMFGRSFFALNYRTGKIPSDLIIEEISS